MNCSIAIAAIAAIVVGFPLAAAFFPGSAIANSVPSRNAARGDKSSALSRILVA
jgi:hypothetical protein